MTNQKNCQVPENQNSDYKIGIDSIFPNPIIILMDSLENFIKRVKHEDIDRHT